MDYTKFTKAELIEAIKGFKRLSGSCYLLDHKLLDIQSRNELKAIEDKHKQFEAALAEYQQLAQKWKSVGTKRMPIAELERLTDLCEILQTHC